MRRCPQAPTRFVSFSPTTGAEWSPSASMACRYARTRRRAINAARGKIRPRTMPARSVHASMAQRRFGRTPGAAVAQLEVELPAWSLRDVAPFASVGWPSSVIVSTTHRGGVSVPPLPLLHPGSVAEMVLSATGCARPSGQHPQPPIVHHGLGRGRSFASSPRVAHTTHRAWPNATPTCTPGCNRQGRHGLRWLSEDAEARLQSVRVRLLPVVGDRDAALLAAQRLSRTVPNAQLIVLPGEDHLSAIRAQAYRDAVAVLLQHVN
jgi:hypothetical protein